MPRRRARTDSPRVGLVLGAGGPLGAAWTAGALAAVQRRVDAPLGDVEAVVGTSAGSILAAALRAGVGVADIVAHQDGTDVDGLPPAAAVENDAHTGLPPLPRPGIGSPRLLVSAALAPLRRPATTVASAWLPPGRGRLTAVEDLVHGLAAHAERTGRRPRRRGRWAPGEHTWVVALDYDRGERVAFGRDGAPPADLARAVAASCAVPGWYRPVEIGGARYVDGGAWSSTSADLLAGRGLDEVYVLAPMASQIPDAPRDAGARLERRFRRHVTAGLRRELRILADGGTAVHLLTPGPADLRAMGANLMDASRQREVLATSLRTSADRFGRVAATA